VVTPCTGPTLTTNLLNVSEGRKRRETVMNMWTQETLQAETDYRRQQLRRLASHRRLPAAHRSGRWYQWVARGLRH
jgi:hypothetical protein